MKTQWFILMFLIVFTVAELIPDTGAEPYDDGDTYQPEDDYADNTIDRLLQSAQKRACIPRGGVCDHRLNDCCYNSACRCNLWGANCRCQRMGLFQKWGK